MSRYGVKGIHRFGAILLLACARLAAAEVFEAREVAPGVFVLPSSHRHASANAGWIALEDRAVLVGAPAAELVPRLLEEAARTTGKAVRQAVLTHVRQGERAAARLLAERGVAIVVPAGAMARLLDGPDPPPRASLTALETALVLGEGRRRLEVRPLAHGAETGGAIVLVSPEAVLFGGAASVNGPRPALAGGNTAMWLEALREMRSLEPRVVVPGFGTPGGPELLDRLESYLLELRRQVGYRVALQWPLDEVRRAVKIDPDRLVWPPYDEPAREDIDHVHAELTVPRAPLGALPFRDGDPRPRALAVIGDGPHEPGRTEAALALAFRAAGIDARFAVDPRALHAETLAAVKLLIILRDGYIWPDGPAGKPQVWMTSEQERAIVSFVAAGGGFLALHNATGLYTEGGPYLELLGGTYNGHGPLERFRIRVLDREHPITRGASDYEVADEQHTPVPGKDVHIILESLSAEGVRAAAGWTRQAGSGRVAYLASGHTREALRHPEHQRLLVNAMRWCLGLGG